MQRIYTDKRRLQNGSVYKLLAGMIQRNDEISSEAIGLIRTQVEDLRDARIESLNERTRTANEYNEQLKHQREDFNRARKPAELSAPGAESAARVISRPLGYPRRRSHLGLPCLGAQQVFLSCW